jgi:hypothetical protein
MIDSARFAKQTGKSWSPVLSAAQAEAELRKQPTGTHFVILGLGAPFTRQAAPIVSAIGGSDRIGHYVNAVRFNLTFEPGVTKDAFFVIDSYQGSFMNSHFFDFHNSAAFATFGAPRYRIMVFGTIPTG